MLREESVGDWMLLSDGDTLVAQACPYAVECAPGAASGLLRIDASSSEGADRIELRLNWPASSRGSLLAGATRYALDRAPEIVVVSAEGEDGSEKRFSGFRLTVLPDEPTKKVLPLKQMVIALRDDGRLADRIQATPDAAEVPTSREELSRLLCERIRARHADPQLEVSGDSISFTGSIGVRNHLALANAWLRVQAGEADVIESFLRSGDAINAGVDSAPSIFPLLKSAGTAAAFLAHAQEIARGEGGQPVALVQTPFAEGVECLFVVDLPSGMRFVTAEELQTAGISEAELPAHAASALYRSLTTVVRLEVQPGVHMLTCGGNYETALPLLPEVWAEVDPLLSGQRVVAIPNRDLLFVTGSDSAKGLSWMREQAAGSEQRAYPVSRELFSWDGTRYQLFKAKQSWFKRLFS